MGAEIFDQNLSSLGLLSRSFSLFLSPDGNRAYSFGTGGPTQTDIVESDISGVAPFPEVHTYSYVTAVPGALFGVVSLDSKTFSRRVYVMKSLGGGG